jgi:hypothetical protein
MLNTYFETIVPLLEASGGEVLLSLPAAVGG